MFLPTRRRAPLYMPTMVSSARRARAAVPLVVFALVAAFAALPIRPAAAAAPADLSNFQGNFACAAGVKLGRVTDVRGVQARAYTHSLLSST